MARMAEWCEHDDFMLHDVVNGKHLAIHVKVQQQSSKSQLKDWSPAGNVRLATTTDPDTVGVQITGPGFEWKAKIFANHGYTMDGDPNTIHQAGETVEFVLRAA